MTQSVTNPDRNVRPAAGAGPPFRWPLAVLLLATVLVWWLDLDQRIARLAYDGQGGWTLDQQWFVQLLYRFGTWPAIITVSVAGIIWLGGRFNQWMRARRRLAMFVAMSIAFGPGVLVNTLFKGFYGRPRPAEVVEFGGQREFAPVWEPHIGEGGKSFPSGHVAMGVFWLAFAVYYYERNRRLAIAFALLALVQGGCMGVGRIVQGGHWFSDVVWAPGMVYFVAWFLYRALRLSPPYSSPDPDECNPTGQ